MNENSTMKVAFKYVVETTAATRPTTGYTTIPNIVSIPAIEAATDSIDVTDLSDEWKRYIPGLKDSGGALALTANNTAAFRTAWAALVTAAETAQAAGKAVWFAIEHPDWDDAFYFAGMPSDLGIGEQSVGGVEQVSANIIPNQIAGYAAAPTAA